MPESEQGQAWPPLAGPGVVPRPLDPTGPIGAQPEGVAGAGSGTEGMGPASPGGAGVETTLQAEAPPRGLKGFWARYGKMLWWLHSLYALGLGVFVILFAARGFAHARWLTISLAGCWIVSILFFRLFGEGRRQAVRGTGAKVRFYVMTYALKNMYQGMLFFLLPFYWRSSVLDAPTQWFVVGLAACAVLSTLDVVFDRVLMKFKIAASLFYFFTLFCCLNLVIPALFPNIRALVTLVAAAVISALSFWTMHIPVRLLGRPAVVTLLVTWTLGSLAGAYFGRSVVPPVAMHVDSGAVGPRLLDDGRLAVEAQTLHRSLIEEDLYAVTQVSIPGGRGDELVHVWHKDGRVVQRSTDLEVSTAVTPGALQLRSKLGMDNVPGDPVGVWGVDVQTADGQLVGRITFEVTP